jgi:uncharacterized membrane protein YcaP (DUF421 family)
MFVVGVPVLEKVIRPILVYAALVVGLRVFGKRELAQLNPFDLVVLLSLANTVQNAIIGDESSVTGGIIGGFTLLLFNYVVVRFLFGHRRLDQWIEGVPTVLIDHGKVIRSALAKELVTENELLSVLHRQGFSTLDEVEHCALEPGGTFAVIAKQPFLAQRRHEELLERLNFLALRLEKLEKALAERS